MSAIRDVLKPEGVDLSISANTAEQAVESLLSRMSGDPRVRDFSGLREAVVSRHAPPVVEGDAAVLIAHWRTGAVGDLVLAAGRIPDGLPLPGTGTRLELVFVAGIPSALASDYLRVVGVLARACKSSEDRKLLLAAPSAAEFISVLSGVEARL